MRIAPGKRMPAGTLKYLGDSGPVAVTSDALFNEAKVVLFSCPGAFTPKSTLQQLPGYVRYAGKFKELGVDSIVCISVNDAFVMDAWGNHCNVGNSIRMLADGQCEYHTAMGLEMDCTRFTLGYRSHRFSMLIDDGVVQILNVEEPGGYEVSDAAVLYEQMKA